MALPLEIELIWHTDSTKELANAGMDFDIDDCVYRTVTFYNIDLIIPYEWDKKHKDFCKIYSSNDEWISPYSYEHVKQMIEYEIL